MKKALPDCLLDELPEHQKREEIPQAFNDSSHRLWRLQTSDPVDRNYFLKVSSNTQSPFWQIMRDLFDFNLETEIIDFSFIYQFVSQACSIGIPQLIKANRCSDTSFVLCTELKGDACDSQISDQMVRQLAKHLAELHSKTNEKWGSLNNPLFSSNDFSKRLKLTLTESANKWGGVFLNSGDYLKQAIEACDSIKPTDFVAMIPDLRWDQFLQDGNKISGFVDLDAFVYAPRELDFVILEIILSSNQIEVFIEVYSKYHDIPDLHHVRPAYRLLLFYMQILGETDLEEWMNKPTFFKSD